MALAGAVAEAGIKSDITMATRGPRCWGAWGTVLVEPDYRRYRIEVNAVAEGDRWNADVTIRRILSSDKPHVERVTCYKLTPEHAERAAEIWARRWVDVNKEGA